MADRMAFHTSYQTSVAAVGIGDMHVTDADAIDCWEMEPIRCTHTVAQADIDGRVADVGHRQVAHPDIFHLCTVDGFKCQTSAMRERTASDSDMTEPAVRFCAKFDAPRRSVTIRSLFGLGGACAIEQRTHIISTDFTILYQHMFRRLCPS